MSRVDSMLGPILARSTGRPAYIGHKAFRLCMSYCRCRTNSKSDHTEELIPPLTSRFTVLRICSHIHSVRLLSPKHLIMIYSIVLQYRSTAPRDSASSKPSGCLVGIQLIRQWSIRMKMTKTEGCTPLPT
jgi:hypothetical protein